MSTTDKEAFYSQIKSLTKAQLVELVFIQDKNICELNSSLLPKPPLVGNYLQEALKVSGVNSERGNVYGSAANNFLRIANLWTAQLGLIKDGGNGKLSRPFTIEEVAIFMDHVKNARLQVSPEHRDSWVDKAGYVNCVADIHAEIVHTDQQLNAATDNGSMGERT